MTTSHTNQPPEKIQLETMMKPAEFKAAGLKHLSREELQQLNQYCNTHFIKQRPQRGEGPPHEPK